MKRGEPKADAAKTSSMDMLKLSFPLFVELFMQFMVGNIAQLTLAPYGEASAAAVGNALALLNLVTIALSAMATASTVLVTRVIGRAGSQEQVNRIATVGLAVNIALGVILTLVLFAFGPHLLAVLNVDEAVRPLATEFLLIMGSSTVVQAALLSCTALLRAHARVKSIMFVGFVMNGVNLAFCAFLVLGAFGFTALGVAGAALSGVAARMAGLAVSLILLRRLTSVSFSLREVRPSPWSTLKDMLRIGVPASGEQMNYDIVQVVILSFVNILGATVVTAKVYCSLLAGFSYLYSTALSQAVQIVLGYLLGSGRLDSAARRVWTADLLAVLLTASASFVLWLNAAQLLALFSADQAVVDLAQKVLLVEVFLSVGRAVNIVMVRSLVSLGSVRAPVVVNVTSSWMMAVCGGYVLGVGLGLGIVGIWLAMCVDEWVRAAVLLGVFASGRWRRGFSDGCEPPFSSARRCGFSSARSLRSPSGSASPQDPSPS